MGAAVTVTFVHALQLLLSSDSVIVPTILILLSAQNRTEYVPAVAKVFVPVAVAVPPAASIAIGAGVVVFIGRVAPAPFAPGATCIELEKVAPVEAVPVLEIVEVNVVTDPTVAVVRVGAEAVRLGSGIFSEQEAFVPPFNP